MKRKVRKGQSVEQVYPNPKGRAAADTAVDKLDPRSTTMSEYLDAWDQAYFEAVGSSPFRGS